LKWFFYAVKMNGQEKWRYLVSTDLSLSFDEVMAHYKVRWTIEVFFKEVKQNLNLNGCQSTDFDALIAHISLVFINYAILSTQRYFSEDATLGGVFKGISTWSVKLTFFAEILSMLSEAGIGFSVDAQEAILVIILKINEMHFPKKQSKQNVKPPSEPLLSKAS
jgi:hypothetical protein